MIKQFVRRGITTVFVALVMFVSVGCESHPSRSDGVEKPILTDISFATSSSQSQLEQSLAGFFKDLHNLEVGQTSQVTILQLGDSHTAGNFFSGRLREKLQARFGDSGRGLMPAGIPFAGLDQRDLKFFQDDGWTIENSLKSPNEGPYGISGFVAHSSRGFARMSLSAAMPENEFDWATVDFLEHPHGGTFTISADSVLVGTVSTAGPEGQVGRYIVKDRGRLGKLEITARSAGIDLTAWGVGKNKRGIILSSHGVVGSTVDIYNHWSPEIVSDELGSMKLSLIIVAYGTNEAFDTDFKAVLYEQNFSHVIENLKKNAPRASILIIGPPDSQRGNPSWGPPPALANVREIQKKIALSEGAAFWDWSSVMPDGMSSWVSRGLARPDHVHFTRLGYEAAADQLYGWLMNAYAAQRNHHATKSEHS